MILSDVRLYRDGLVQLLSVYRDVEVLADGPCDSSMLQRVVEERPAVVLIDAASVYESPIVRELARLAPNTAVLACGVGNEDRHALRCVEVGIAAFLPPVATTQQLVDAVLELAAGEFRCSPRVAALLLKRFTNWSDKFSGSTVPLSHLTPREWSVAKLIEEGLSNKEIAARLGIEVSTVKNHVHHILEKLHAERRALAAARLRRARLVDHYTE